MIIIRRLLDLEGGPIPSSCWLLNFHIILAQQKMCQPHTHRHSCILLSPSSEVFCLVSVGNWWICIFWKKNFRRIFQAGEQCKLQFFFIQSQYFNVFCGEQYWIKYKMSLFRSNNLSILKVFDIVYAFFSLRLRNWGRLLEFLFLIYGLGIRIRHLFSICLYCLCNCLLRITDIV